MSAIRGHAHAHLAALGQRGDNTPPTNELATAVIPTIANSPTLTTAIATLQRQTIAPRIIIVDTGSNIAEYIDLERRLFHIAGIELLRIAPRKWSHLSERVAAALDLGISQVESEYCYLTHDDVFLKRPNVLSELIHLLRTQPADFCGYEMSDRSHVTEQWHGMLSHTCTMFRTQSHRRHQLRWSLAAALKRGDCDQRPQGWPDTETNIGLQMREKALAIHFIGHETNEQHFEDDRLYHRRSLSTHRFLWPELATKDAVQQAAALARFAEPING